MHIEILIIVLLVVLILLICLSPSEKTPKQASTSCSASCSSQDALDPVNDPDYNMREAIKQTLLLEQHLAEKAKYCKSCICKHFLLIESLLEEAVWMACTSFKDYPKLEESAELIKKLFKLWHAHMDDNQTRLNVLSELRDWRREAVDLYYF